MYFNSKINMIYAINSRYHKFVCKKNRQPHASSVFHAILTVNLGGKFRFNLMPVFDDFQKIFGFLRIQRRDPPVIQNQKIVLQKSAEFLSVSSIRACEMELVKDLCEADVMDNKTCLTSVMSKGLREKAFADSGRADQEKILMTFDSA